VGHTGTTYVVDEHGQVLVEWSFGTPPEDMANDLRVLLARQAA
jgi:cytochrome oxidase Cu insertion factor (SCO1/SenC/PrrC family)